jgi:hypothetical protein
MLQVSVVMVLILAHPDKNAMLRFFGVHIRFVRWEANGSAVEI